MRGPLAVVILVITVLIWVFFVSRAINVFGEHLRHERDILWEAQLLLDRICDLPRSSFPLTGELVRCDEARDAVRRGNAHLRAIELTSTRLLSELARAARHELVDVTWALGFVGVVATLGIATAWLVTLKVVQYMKLQHETKRIEAYSPMTMDRHRHTFHIQEKQSGDSDSDSGDTEFASCIGDNEYASSGKHQHIKAGGLRKDQIRMIQKENYKDE